jgi:hypothetical protein
VWIVIPFFVLTKATIALDIVKGSGMESSTTAVIAVVVHAKTLHGDGATHLVIQNAPPLILVVVTNGLVSQEVTILSDRKAPV